MNGHKEDVEGRGSEPEFDLILALILLGSALLLFL